MNGYSEAWALTTSPAAISAMILIVSGLLAWAGISKLRSPRSAAAAAVQFRIIRRPRKAFGLALGSAELGIALTLLHPPTQRLALVGAAMLTFAFVALIARALVARERFKCACFGSSGEEIGPAGLWRAGLMCGACLIAIASAPQGWTDVATTSQALSLACLAVGVPLLIRTYRAVKVEEERLDETLDWEWIVQEVRASTPLLMSGEK